MLRSFLRPLLLASTAAALAATPACKPKASGSEQSAEAAADPIQIKSRTVSKEPMPVLMMLTGTLRAEREARVAASVAGRVDKMHVARGAQVKAGQVLAELDSSSASLSAAEAQKASQTAKVQRELAKKDCERAQQLFEAGAISKSDYDARKAQCENAELGVEAAGIRTAIGAKMIKDASIRAPFAGTVESRDTEVGEFLLPGSRVATIVAIDKLRLEVVVPEAQLARVSVGTSLSFRVAAYKERSFSAQVTVIGATVRPGTRDVLVEATVDNADGALKPGMFTTVEIVTAEEPAPCVPLSALVKRGDASHVFVVVDGRAHERIVKLGPERAGSVAIVRGLAAGDRVVDAPPEALKNGAPVAEGG